MSGERRPALVLWLGLRSAWPGRPAYDRGADATATVGGGHGLP